MGVESSQVTRFHISEDYENAHFRGVDEPAQFRGVDEPIFISPNPQTYQQRMREIQELETQIADLDFVHEAEIQHIEQLERQQKTRELELEIRETQNRLRQVKKERISREMPLHADTDLVQESIAFQTWLQFEDNRNSKGDLKPPINEQRLKREIARLQARLDAANAEMHKF